MTQNTKIEWADHTFNPWWGCTKISPACDNCYAQALDKRVGGDHWGAGKPRKHTSIRNWLSPLKWNKHAEHFVECTGCGRRGDSRTWEADIIKDRPTAITCCPDRNLVKARPRVFCASMADVFDNEVDPKWRQDLFALINATQNLDWLLLTKRIGNVPAMVSTIPNWMPANVLMGITICNQEEADRDIPKLLSIPAAKRFLSIEPMLGPINLTDLNTNSEEYAINSLNPWTWEQEIAAWRGTSDDWEDDFEDYHGTPHTELIGYMHPAIDWVICGGESGHGARPMHPDWARSLRDQCFEVGVPFMFKQWGDWYPRSQWEHSPHIVLQDIPNISHPFTSPKNYVHLDGDDFHKIGKKDAGRLLDGLEHNGFPT